MPLFTMPKKTEIKEDSQKDNKILTTEIKTQQESIPIITQEDYAILGSNKLKFYYILYSANKKPFKNITHTYLPNDDILENKILTEMYALKVLIENLKRANKKEITIYSNIKNLDVIKNHSQLKDMGSMFRYKGKEIMTLLESYPSSITFKEINPKIQEVLDNENKI